MTPEELSKDVLDAIRIIATEKGFTEYNLETKPISGLGENSYGLVMQIRISCEKERQIPFFCVIKIAPMNYARRQCMKVVAYYQREIFMYDRVLKSFREIQEAANIAQEHSFDAVPEMYFSSLKNMDEFIIFEDLTQKGFSQNCRKNLPTFELSAAALKALARFHAMSFVMQAKRPKAFEDLVNEIRFKDNLYTPNMDQVTIEFAKKYICRTKSMIGDDKHRTDQAELLEVVQIFEEKFKEIALKAVSGGESSPYSVICHGDFWNNNILYRYDKRNNPIVAKLIDFQMSRYASPVLDIVHYLFACTEKDLRDAHFYEFLQIYYDTLAEQLQLFGLNPDKIYPRSVLDSQIKTYGPYGFCMAIFSVPFFITDSVDIPDLDKVSEAINELSSEGSDVDDRQLSEGETHNSAEMIKKSKNLVNEFELLNEKTIPVFKRRLTGILLDLFKYDMVAQLKEFSKHLDEERN